MPRSVAQVQQTAFGEHDDGMSVGEDEFVNLRLDVDFLHIGRQPGEVYLVVEVSDVADYGLMLHAA